MPISAHVSGAPLIHVAVRFTAGQYSARPWGEKADCGRHEWPPSPYRIIRAAAAAWKYNLPDIPEERFHAVVRRLASELPAFRLPRAGLAAVERGVNSRPGTPPWRICPDQAVHVVWQGAALTGGEERTLADVLAHVHYLGRTDSWCEMRLGGADGAGADGPASAAPADSPPLRINCRPYDHNRKASPGAVPARVIVPRPGIAMEDVYRKVSPSDEERASACPDGGMAVPYLIDRDAAGPSPIGRGRRL